MNEEDQVEEVDTESEETTEEEFDVDTGLYLKGEIYDKGKAYLNKNKKIYAIGSKEEFNPITGLYEQSIEKKLDSKDRKKMDKTEFGIPELKKYPLNDVAHIKSAISYFNKAPAKYKHSLAIKISKAAKKYGVTISKTSDVYKELHKNDKKSKEILLDYSIESYINVLIK